MMQLNRLNRRKIINQISLVQILSADLRKEHADLNEMMKDVKCQRHPLISMNVHTAMGLQ